MNTGLKDIATIFGEALEIASPADRNAYLNRVCAGHPECRQRVEELLRDHARIGDFLEGAAGPRFAAQLAPTDVHPGAEPLGTMIGSYKLREVLGEGGMGIVYAAEQEHPIRRKVALKIIKPGMDSKEVVARFEAERQALALMDHPHIAKVIDAGTTETGRPYFVMELVRGLPITEYCDQRRLPPRERLKLFITVCQALQHAHQKGIVHRDLKPSNVMITLHDGVPVPKIIDFGVAKALNQRLTDHTLYTRVAQLLGTPMYMSPEQAELSGLEIDTRSDVYSLGVLLYELLTGETPFDKETFSKLGYDELRRMIREDEPPRPSQRLSTLSAEARTTTAQRRGGDDRQLARALRGELDWIVMKALEKDRTRRYGSADGLASDLQAYLADQPVQACPPSYVYRLQKFARRKRGLLSTLALLAICAPLAVLGVHSLIKTSASQPVIQHVASPDGTSPIPDQGKESHSAAPKAHLNARAAGRYLPGLIPEPPLIPDVGRWQMIPKKPRGRLYSAVWSPDERWIALGETVNIRIYDASSMQLVRVLVGHTAPVFSVAWHPSGERLASAGEDGTVRLWTSDGVPTHLLEGHLGPVYQVAWRPDGERLASVSADGSVRTWNADGSPHLVLDTPHAVVGTQGYHVFCVDWSPDGKLLASGGGDMCPPPEGGPYGDTAVRIWDAEAGSLVRKLDAGMKHSVLCVDWRPDGKQIAAGYGEVCRNVQGGGSPIEDAGIRVWNVDGTVAPGPENISKDGSINSIAWHPRGHILAYGAYNAPIPRIWNPSEQTVANITENASNFGWIYKVTWKQDGSGLLTTHRESLREWDAAGNPTDLIEILRQVGAPNVVKWSPDGSLIAATRAEDGSHSFWNSAGTPTTPPPQRTGDGLPWWGLDRADRRPDGKPAPVFEAVPFPIVEPAWSTNGWFAGSCKRLPQQAVAIWDDIGKLAATIRNPHRGATMSLAWSPAGEQLVTVGTDSVRLWERNGDAGPVLCGHLHEGIAVAWSPDGRWIASGGLDSTIRIWKRDGTPGPILKGQPCGTLSLAWSPDSQRLASLSYMPDCTVRIWNIETGKTEWQSLYFAPDLRGTFSPTGRLLSGDAELLSTKFLFLAEQDDGSMNIFSHDKIKKYFAELRLRELMLTFDKAMAARNFVVAESEWHRTRADLLYADKHQQFQFIDLGFQLARGLDFQRDYVRAEQTIRNTIDLQREAIAQFPDEATQSLNLARQLLLLGMCLSAVGRNAESLSAFSEAIEIEQRLVDATPTNSDFRRKLMQTFVTCAFRQATEDDAIRDFQQALDVDPKCDWLSWALEDWLDDLMHEEARMLSSVPAREISVADHIRIAKAVVREAIRRAPDLVNQNFIGEWFLTCPERYRDSDFALQLAERAIELKLPHAERTRAWALFRKGDAEACIDILNQTQLSNDIDERAPSQFILALAHCSLQNQEQARANFETGSQWLPAYKSKCYESRWKSFGYWHVTADTAERLRDEAAKLLSMAANGEVPADAAGSQR